MAAFGELVWGYFIERPNRFLARVELSRGVVVEAHVPNSGRLKELLTPGASVLVREVQSQSRKTSCDLVLVEHRSMNPPLYVCIDTRLPGLLFAAGLEQGLPAVLKGFSLERAEVRFLRSRLDFRLKEPSGTAVFVEVKSVTLVRDGLALFPDAPSARAGRHLEDLMQAPALGRAAAIVFVVQRPDASCFSANDETDPLFGRRLRQAVRRGVKVAAYNCRVNPERIEPAREIPVLL